MSTILQDLRYAARQLLRVRSATIIVVLTLALGIGANTSMFTLLNALLFKPAPGANADRLAWLSNTDRSYRRAGALSYPDLVAYRTNMTTFDAMAAWHQTAMALGGAIPERINGALVTGNFFDVLGIPAEHGRTFAADEDVTPGLKPVVVLSHALWTRRYAANPRMIDSSITLNGHLFTVVGIAPEGFGGLVFDDPIELWVPIAMLPVVMPGSTELFTSEHAGWLEAVGRLKNGVTIAQANSDARVVAARLVPGAQGTERAKYAIVQKVAGGLPPSNRAEVAPVMALASIVPLLVLVIACANAANVQLAQMLARGKELAVRRAIGASRTRLMRQLLTESVVLSLVAGALGVLFSFWLTAGILQISAAPSFIADSLAPDRRVLIATTALAMLSGLFFGIAPALAASRPQVASALKNDSISLAGGRHRLRNVLVVAQVAVSLLLIVTAGLFMRSLGKSLTVEPGFNAHHLATASFDLAMLGYSKDAQSAFQQRLLDNSRAIPGIQSAALATVMPLSGTSWGNEVQLEDALPDDRGQSTRYSSVSPEFLRTMGIGLTKGRDFTNDDRASAAKVAIINETLARRLWPGQDPIGKRFRLAGRNEPLREVIGITATGKYDSLNESESSYLYVPLSQLSDVPNSALALVVKSAGDPATALSPLSALFRTLDPNLALFRVETIDQSLARGVDKQRAASSMLGVFGALALLLAAFGIYGVTAHGVSVRTREIGIRVSLGAQTTDVLAMFVGEGLRLSMIGVLIGLAASIALSKVLASFLFGLSATDAPTFAAGAVVLCTVAVFASFIPARRAARVDPMVALRYD